MKHAWLMLLPWNVIFFTPWAEAQQLGQEQQGTIAEIKKLGGKVETERDGSGKSFLTVNLEDRKIPDEFLKRFRGWSNLRKLNLSGTQINGSGLQYLADLPGLKALDLSLNPIETKAMPHVARLAGLETLNLSSTKVTEGGLVHLRKLKNLRELWLDGSRQDGKSLRIEGDPFSISTRITDVGMRHLGSLKNLRLLSLDCGGYLRDCPIRGCFHKLLGCEAITIPAT